jgi:predicted small integral membrane protein
MDLRLLASSIKEQVEGVTDGETLESDISKVINAAFLVIGLVAAIMIVVGGVNYMTAQGDPSKVTKGKKIMITGLVGLIIALLAFAIVNFVLNALQQTV